MTTQEELLQRLLAEAKEPLHPDLVPYYETDGARNKRRQNEVLHLQ